MMPQFTTDARIPSAAVTREMVILKKQLGGVFGHIDVDGKEIPVLQLDQTNYVAGKVDWRDKTLLSLAGLDVHPIETAHDAQFLRAKYKRYYGR